MLPCPRLCSFQLVQSLNLICLNPSFKQLRFSKSQLFESFVQGPVSRSILQFAKPFKNRQLLQQNCFYSGHAEGATQNQSKGLAVFTSTTEIKATLGNTLRGVLTEGYLLIIGTWYSILSYRHLAYKMIRSIIVDCLPWYSTTINLYTTKQSNNNYLPNQ